MLRHSSCIWRRSIRKRTADAFSLQWRGQDERDFPVIKTIGKIMSLPHSYLYLDDRMKDILSHPYPDFSDVECVLYLEKELHCVLDVQTLQELTLREVLSMRVGGCVEVGCVGRE